MSTWQTMVSRGVAASRPASSTVPVGALYFETDTQLLKRNNGSSWDLFGPALLVGDSGSGGTAGFAPAPGAGDAAAGKFLKADGTWAAPEPVTSTKGDILASNGSAFAILGVGSNTQVLTADSTQTLGVKWAAASGGGGGKTAQVVHTETGAVATGTTQIPFDDTIPQNTEGDQYMSLAITPTNSSSTLMIDIIAMLTVTTTPWVTVALYQDSTANALAAITQFVNLSTTGGPIKLRHFLTAGTTSSTTFKTRAGPSSAATITFNGQSGGRLFGGAMASSMTITEFTP